MKIENKIIGENTLKELGKIVLLKKINKEVVEFVQNLEEENKKLKVIKDQIINRIEYVIKNVFVNNNVEIHIYGSSITGLALANSDIDLQIKGFDNLSRLQTENKLKELFEVLANFEWINNSSQMILTSTVPIIKLDINPLVKFSRLR